MAIVRRAGRTRPLIVLLVLLSLTLVVVDQAGDSSPVHPIRAGVRDGYAAVSRGANALWPFRDSEEVRRLKNENSQLRSKLDVANGELAKSADAERERKELVDLLALPSPDNVDKVIAKATNIGVSNFDATLELSKGARDGIRSGMPVVTAAGLVGRVVQTSATQSTVLLITDTTSNVSVRYSNAGDIGVVAGTGINKSLRGDLINLDSPVNAGEIALTSGLDGSLFPAGIPVAKVRSSTTGPQDLRRNIVLDPIADLTKLNDVAVLLWHHD